MLAAFSLTQYDINYYLADEAEQVTVEFLDAAGTVLATYESAEDDEEGAIDYARSATVLIRTAWIPAYQLVLHRRLRRMKLQQGTHTTRARGAFWKIGRTESQAAAEPPGMMDGPSRAPSSPPDMPAPR